MRRSACPCNVRARKSSTPKRACAKAVHSGVPADITQLMPNPTLPQPNADARPVPRGRALAASSPLLFVPIGADASPCDLLHEQPIGRLELRGALEALSFAFASGDGDVFTRLLDHTPTAPTRFDPDDFARDLELRLFVERCLPVLARAHG